ncbi:MAG: hypothetical protein RMI56_03275 [Sulfolobales archaeon]|nr:hypothetical protein [Sulfolobales archaeon]
MSKFKLPKIRGFLPLLALGIVVLAVAIVVLIWSIAYMERAMVATALISGLVGFSLLSASLYILRLAAYAYGVETGGSS